MEPTDTSPEAWVIYMGRWLAAIFANKESITIGLILSSSYLLRLSIFKGRWTAIVGLLCIGPVFYVFAPIKSLIRPVDGLHAIAQNLIIALCLSVMAYIFQRVVLRRLTGKDIYDGNTEFRTKDNDGN